MFSSGFITLDFEVICAQSLLVSIDTIWNMCLVKKKKITEISKVLKEEH